MQQYRWKAVSASGENLSGIYSAADDAEAAAFVRSNYGYLIFLQRLESKNNVTAAGKYLRQIFSRPDSKLTDEEKAIFFSQLAMMLDSGLPLLRALSILAERLPHKAARLCLGLQEDLRNGRQLAKSMQKKPEAWGPLAAAVVAAGEEGGILCEMLEELAQYYRLQAQMKRFIKNISLYPLFLFTASLITALLFIVKVLPLFADLYASMGAGIPLYLQLLFGVQNFLADNWLLAGPALACAAFWAVNYRQRLLQLLFSAPFFKAQKKLYLEIRFDKILALLLQGGLPLPMAVQLAGEALGDAALRQQAETFAKEVLRGTSPAKAAAQAENLFGSLSVEFISVGAETGRLPEMLSHASELLQQHFDDTVKKIQAMLEPLLLLLVAAFVSAVIIAVAAPMFSLSGALPGK